MAFKLNLRSALLSVALTAAIGGVVFAGDLAVVSAQTPQYAIRQPLSDADAQLLGHALAAAKLGDPGPARNALTQLSDPTARKIALWALVDTDPSGMSYAELDSARRDLAGWPGAGKREAATEKVLEGGGLGPQATIDWFAGSDPTTPEGAMALAAAYQSTGQAPKAADVIRHIWRTKVLDGATQQLVLSRFGSLLSSDDIAARATTDADSASRLWTARGGTRDQVVAAIKAGDSRTAYQLAANSGVATGADGAEAEFYAGWLALDRLKDPKLADLHFAKLQGIGVSPITVSRALYWRGKAAEAAGDQLNAQLFYASAAKYQTAFYGQLAAVKAGITDITLTKDPEITAADRARFEDRSEIRAARMLGDIGAKETFRGFVLSLANVLPSAAEEAQLVDLARSYDEQELSMKVVRSAASHGYILPERGYPLRTPSSVSGGAETALVLGITREESGFDPKVRSAPGATGMMQLMPGTASGLARRLGYAYSFDKLSDADFNMQLGSAYLGQLVGQFDGSYVMAAAAYNAGPGRPTEWTAYCGDPRSSSTDPADYIECIPFPETRNYVMRVLEATEVYRARLGGGTARNLLPSDLKRGAYGYGAPSTALTATTLGVTAQ